MRRDDAGKVSDAVGHGTPVAASQICDLINSVTNALIIEAETRLTEAEAHLEKGNHSAAAQSATVAKAFASLSRVTRQVSSEIAKAG